MACSRAQTLPAAERGAMGETRVFYQFCRQLALPIDPRAAVHFAVGPAPGGLS